MPRKHNVKGRSRNEGQYFLLPYSMTRSEAWRSLGGYALKVFIELRCRFNGSNNGALRLSYDEATRLLGGSKSTVARAFKELEEKGFIVKTKEGRWYGRLATEWRVTDKPCNGHLATRDWQNWKPKKKQILGTVTVP